MKNRWDDKVADSYGQDLLGLRVYSSRLLGQEEDLVLHGGGNTSVKLREQDLFGDEEDILYVKGSGWDLATIEKEGFAPVRLEALQRLATLPALDDLEMVRQQRLAMTDPNAPNPSVEAILHAIIPFRFVDHTHADAIVTISNTPNGAQRIKELYGDTVLIVPYVMPGFILACEIYAMTRELNWSTISGMIL
ncbi:MAG: class II aldolase/adducin family protein, partial [Saprospiraceae bacterium]|nr:class II aldolase/adducin family protein [Saprospiraceae bacterium]